MKKAYGRILHLFLSISYLAVCFNVYTSLAFRAESKTQTRHFEDHKTTFEDPYQNKVPLRWLKASFHNHTNEV